MLAWLPENVSSYGGEIDSLLYLIYYITLAWFIATQGAILLFLFLSRRREGRRARYIPGESLSQAAWILAPAVLVLVLDFWIDLRGASVWAKIKQETPAHDLRVRVTAKQFAWEILYPGPDGKFGTSDDLKLDNEFHVPVGRVVRLDLRANDVIHSLFLPNLRYKQDMVPGRELGGWFKATKTGRYEMPCAELCGFGHSGMKGWLYVHSEESWRRWARERWPGS